MPAPSIGTAPAMVLNDPSAYRRCEELELMAELLPLSGADVIELGCGAAFVTRALTERLGAARVTATEVDRIQHEKNLALDLPGVSFRYGGAEAIDAPDGSFDGALMLKSLHHVPAALMDQALGEVYRVLKPGGWLYCSEPVYWGPFNEVMRLIDDERVVREAAFAALTRAVEQGRFALEAEVFFQSEGVYPDWDGFAARFIHVTHSPRDLSAGRIAEIRAAFEAHLQPGGARFLKPHRVDLMRKVG